MKNIIEMTWKEIMELDKENSIICITIAPIEEHGLHLPLGTDVYEGEHWLKKMAIQVEKKIPNRTVFKLPPLTVASATATGFYGCIYYETNTTRQVTYEMLKNIANWGFKHIVIIASHGDPVHHIAIEIACETINKEYGVCAISPMGAFFSADQLSIELGLSDTIKEVQKDFPNDIHAGWIETSAMLHIREDLVKQTYQQIEDTLINDKEMLSAKKILNVMGKYGHLGAPRLASKNIGKELNENTVEYLVCAVKAFIERKGYEQYKHHFLYHILSDKTC